jgi:septum formation protein
MVTDTQVILASGSPRRRELLASLGVSFTVVKSDVDETQQTGEPPLDYVRRLSREKAQAVAAQLTTSAAVLAADTVVILAADTMGIFADTHGAGAVLGKPADAEEARTMLRQLRGRAHVVCTALTLLARTRTGIADSVTELAQTLVTMRDYSDTEIEDYIASGDPFDKAGAYAIQNEAFHPVAHYEGSYSNVMGLPLETLRPLLARFGVVMRA